MVETIPIGINESRGEEVLPLCNRNKIAVSSNDLVNLKRKRLYGKKKTSNCNLVDSFWVIFWIRGAC
jgi:hypothetical protein